MCKKPLGTQVMVNITNASSRQIEDIEIEIIPCAHCSHKINTVAGEAKLVECSQCGKEFHIEHGIISGHRKSGLH